MADMESSPEAGFRGKLYQIGNAACLSLGWTCLGMGLPPPRNEEPGFHQLLFLRMDRQHTAVSCFRKSGEYDALPVTSDDPHIPCRLARKHLQPYNEREELIMDSSHLLNLFRVLSESCIEMI